MSVIINSRKFAEVTRDVQLLGRPGPNRWEDQTCHSSTPIGRLRDRLLDGTINQPEETSAGPRLSAGMETARQLLAKILINA